MSKKGHRFEKLRSIDCFPQVDRRVRSGEKLIAIARYIQNDRQEYDDVHERSLVKVLSSYRDSLRKTDIIQTREPDKYQSLLLEVEDAVDEIKELAHLYGLQKGRIATRVREEMESGYATGTIRDEISTALQLLKTSANLKLDMGLYKSGDSDGRDASVFSLDITAKYGSESLSRIFHDPASRRKMIGLVERLSSVAKEKRDELLGEALAEEPLRADVDVAKCFDIEAELVAPEDPEILKDNV